MTDFKKAISQSKDIVDVAEAIKKYFPPKEAEIIFQDVFKDALPTFVMKVNEFYKKGKYLLKRLWKE